MANKVLTFKSNKPVVDTSLSAMEVYIDIDTKAVRNVNYRGIEIQLSDYIAYLGTELGTNPSKLRSDISTICPENQVITDETASNIISCFAVTLSAGFDEMYSIYEKYTMPYRYRIGKLVNVKAVQNSLKNIFTWIPGERVINPEFGSRLQLYLYEQITDENQEAIVSEIRHCVSEWEPRVEISRIVNITSVQDREDNTVRLDIYYTIKGLNDQQFKYSYEYHRVGST